MTLNELLTTPNGMAVVVLTIVMVMGLWAATDL